MLFVSASLLAQSGQAPCPSSRPVDDFIAQIHDQQAKKKKAEKNPLPEYICIFGWCRGHARTPPTIPEPAPKAGTEPEPDVGAQIGEENGTAETPQEKCDQAMEMALRAAHDVDVGDYYFDDKDYRGALMRYLSAAEEKPQDAAIHVRLGRAYEKLKQDPKAIEEYKLSLTFAGPQKWLDEAKVALGQLEAIPKQ